MTRSPVQFLHRHDTSLWRVLAHNGEDPLGWQHGILRVWLQIDMSGHRCCSSLCCVPQPMDGARRSDRERPDDSERPADQDE
jgi:hypothetical protein